MSSLSLNLIQCHTERSLAALARGPWLASLTYQSLQTAQKMTTYIAIKVYPFIALFLVFGVFCASFGFWMAYPPSCEAPTTLAKSDR